VALVNAQNAHERKTEDRQSLV